MSFGFTETWAQAIKNLADEGEEWDDPIDGDYDVRAVKGRVESTSNGEIGKVRLRVLGGEYDGKGFDHVMTFATDFGMKMTVLALRGYGVDVDRIKGFDDFNRELEALAGIEAAVTVTHSSRGFVNVRVNDARRPELPQLPADSNGGQPADSDDDIPF